MKLSTVILGLSTLVPATFAWTLQTDYSGNNFLNKFTYYSGADPTNGFVQYQSQADAQSKGLAFVRNNRIIIKPDNTTVTPNGRPSVRLESTARYNSGLFLFDLNHMPIGCGTWPAYWMFGDNWPNNGEIDIIEGVNNQASNGFALHTKAGCTMSGAKQTMTGSLAYPNCDVNAAGQPANNGCSIKDPRTNSYGTGLNNNGGGVYAVRWTKEAGIQIWFFTRNAIPSDIKSGNPNPAAWGVPAADYPFGSNCNANNFNSLKVVINLTFCGDWAGQAAVYAGCPSTCNAYVQNNPKAFDQAYWDINYLKVYQQ